MQRTIQQITQQLIDKLPDNNQYYRLDELRSWGFPSFIVQRIQIELERNLAESMIIPKTDWANTQSEAVQTAWQQFVDAIRAEARLPASYAKTVIETAVADVIEMLVQPRRNIPKIVFSGDDELSYEEVSQRMKLVVVYKHFAQLIPRYMEKKELEKLSKERCAKVIASADEKLTERYSPLNWAQMLEPIFKLVDGTIDTNLLRLFFEDKKKPRVARKFDLMNESLTRAELIEVLSSPDLLDFEGYEDEQSTLFEDQPEADKDTVDFKNPVEETQSINDQEEDEKPATAPEDQQQESAKGEEDSENEAEEETEPTLNSGFTQEEEKQQTDSTEDEDDTSGSLNDVFSDFDEQDHGDEAEVVERTELSQPEEEGAQPAPDEKEGFEQAEEQVTESTEEEDEPANQQEEPESQDFDMPPSDNGQEVSDEDSDEEETPIWMRYMSDEEIEEYQKEQQEQAENEEQHEQVEDEVEEGFIDDPVIDLTNEDASDQEIENLRNILNSDRDLFVEEIFRGSDRAYDEAVEDIAAYNSWRDVSKYIEKEVFKRNLVDMYSEAAVDFTDRLQTYFLEKENQSK